MKYVDIKAVLQLVRSIASDVKTLTSNAEELRAKLSALEGTFHDDGFEEVNDYSKRLISTLLNSKQSLSFIITQLVNYAELLQKGKGMDTAQESGLSELGDRSQEIEAKHYASMEPKPKVLSRDKDSAIASGLNAIDAQMDLLRDDCKDKGITDPNVVEAIVAQRREAAEIEFYNDLYGEVETNAINCLGRLSSYFTESTWANLAFDERQDALNTLAKDAGKAFRTDIFGIVFFDGPPQERGYYNGDGFLHINYDCITNPGNRIDAIDTIFHEGRHAFQHAAIKNPHKYGVTNAQAQIWDQNFRHYLTSERFGYDRYFNQPVEADAYSFADTIIRNGGLS